MKNNYMYSYQSNSPYYRNNYNYPINTNNPNDERLIGAGFLGPFVLGGITGGLVAPYFYRPQAYYYQPGPYRPPYYYGRPPYYGPGYGPRPF